MQTDRTEDKRIHPDFLGFLSKWWRSGGLTFHLLSCAPAEVRSSGPEHRNQMAQHGGRRLEAEFVHMHLVQRAVEDVLCVFGCDKSPLRVHSGLQMFRCHHQWCPNSYKRTPIIHGFYAVSSRFSQMLLTRCTKTKLQIRLDIHAAF